MSSLKRKEHITWRREESIMEQIISLVTSEVNTKHRNLLPYTLWLQCKPLIHRACFIHYTISVCFMTNSGSPFIETHNNEACGHDSREHRFSPQRGQFECAIVGWPGKNNKWATLEISCPDVTEEQKSHWEYSPDVTDSHQYFVKLENVILSDADTSHSAGLKWHISDFCSPSAVTS